MRVVTLFGSRFARGLGAYCSRPFNLAYMPQVQQHLMFSPTLHNTTSP
jgi:hypothetical protein